MAKKAYLASHFSIEEVLVARCQVLGKMTSEVKKLTNYSDSE